MTSQQTDAIVLRVFPWSETSCIANLFTSENGKISVLAKGARRPKSPFEAALDLLSTCRIVFIPKAGDTLSLLTEAKLTKRFRAGERDLLRLYAGYYVAELLDRLTEKDDRQPELFELARVTLQALDAPSLDVRAIVLRWELQILRLLGSIPIWDHCANCGESVDADRATIFSPASGGILCAKCKSDQRQTVSLPAGVRKVLVDYSQNDWKSMDVRVFPESGRQTIRSIIVRYLTVLVDRKLQLHPYLEELGR